MQKRTYKHWSIGEQEQLIELIQYRLKYHEIEWRKFSLLAIITLYLLYISFSFTAID
ncbi:MULTISPECIES: hypothetical protein [Metabacillus]|uniref:hypothetical protein n=1 Tax=Metabacillus TaxID=2675233 RepID=UPI001E53B284|nr:MULTISPECIES: hypothetical protein [Metabacillus]UGB33530.1 hypothetical protein LPC09_26650 [Metabacillus sp. B2-18]